MMRSLAGRSAYNGRRRKQVEVDGGVFIVSRVTHKRGGLIRMDL